MVFVSILVPEIRVVRHDMDTLYLIELNMNLKCEAKQTHFNECRIVTKYEWMNEVQKWKQISF